MRDDVRRAFENLTEAPHPALRSSVRARLTAGPARVASPVYRLAAVAAAVIIVVLAGYGGLRYLGTRGNGTGLAGQPSPSPSASANPSPAPTYTQKTVPPGFVCGDLSGGAQGGQPVEVTDVRTSTNAGYDRFVIQFSGPVPQFNLTRQDSPNFTTDASGQPVNLAGAGGDKLVLHGATSMEQWAVDTSRYPELKGARQIGDFEAVYSWGFGVAAPDGGCIKFMVLSGPDRLVLDFLQP